MITTIQAPGKTDLRFAKMFDHMDAYASGWESKVQALETANPGKCRRADGPILLFTDGVAFCPPSFGTDLLYGKFLQGQFSPLAKITRAGEIKNASMQHFSSSPDLPTVEHLTGRFNGTSKETIIGLVLGWVDTHGPGESAMSSAPNIVLSTVG